MARQGRRREGRQDIETPPEFIRAVEKRFGRILIDIAAHAQNRKAETYLGPGGLYEDALAVDWAAIWHTLNPRPFGDVAWLNHPFAKSAPWHSRAWKYAPLAPSMRLLVLSPHSSSTEWYRDHVMGRGHIVALSPRIQFIDPDRVAKGLKPESYPKCLMLSVHNPPRLEDGRLWPMYCQWDWANDVVRVP